MDRKQYNQCIRPYITGSKPKEQRRLDFCIGAKICSKGVNREEAERLCRLPKEPKSPKIRGAKRGQTCEKSAHLVAECVVSRLVENDVYRDQALNINSVGAAITNALIECECPKQ